MASEDSEHPSDDLLLPRGELSAQLSRLCQEHARVVVTGKGGVGKSAFLAQWARASLDAASPVFLDAVEFVASGSWLATRLSRALGMGDTHDRAREDNAITLARVAAISEAIDSRPVLIVALDAADEAPDAVEFTRRLWEAFRGLERDAARGKPPPATLVVSCRDIGSHGMRSLLQRSPIPDSQRRGFESLEIPMFTNAEVTWLEAMLAGAGEAVNLELVEDMRAVDLEGLLGGPQDALRHPIMWRFFSEFPEATRDAVKRGDTAALHEWAQKVVMWVCHRIEQRTGRSQRCEQTAEVLGAIGRAGVWDSAGSFTQSAFRSQAIAEGLDTLSVVELLDQLESSGLVVPISSQSKRWAYPFVAGYLARQGGE